MADLVTARARQTLRYAVRTGRIIRPAQCAECGGSSSRIEAHHHRGYAPEHALDVVWLCQRCHHAADVQAHERARQSRIGVPHSPERRAAIGAAHRGRTIPAEHRAKISATLKGRYFSPEHRAKISATLKGRPLSPETRAKLSAALKGKPLSVEHRARLVGLSAGAKNPKAKLRESDIPAIRALHGEGMSNAAIAQRYGVHSATIYRIVAGKAWRTVA